MNRLILMICYFSIIQTKLIVIRRSSGDKVIGEQKSCRRSETFYDGDLENPCISSQEDIGCQLNILHYKHKIPTLIPSKAKKTLTVELPFHECVDQHTVLKVQYWNYRNGKAVWSTRMIDQLTDTMKGKLKTANRPAKATIRFKKHLHGLLLKLTFGCIDPDTEASTYYDEDCLLVKFSGQLSYPVTVKYFDTIQRSTAFPGTSEASPHVTPKSDTTTIGPAIITTEAKDLNTSTTNKVPSVAGRKATQTKISEKSTTRETTSYVPVLITGKHFKVKTAIAICVVIVLLLVILNVLLCTFCRKRTKKEESELFEKEKLLEQPEKEPEKGQPIHEAFNAVYDIVKTPAHLSPYVPDRLKTEEEPTYAKVNRSERSS